MPLYILNHFVLLHSEVFTQLHPESIFLLSFLTWLTSLLVASPFLNRIQDPKQSRLQVEVVSLTDFQPLHRNNMKNLPFHQVHRSYHPIFSPPKKWWKKFRAKRQNQIARAFIGRRMTDLIHVGPGQSHSLRCKPLSVRLIYGFCKKDKWDVRFTKGKEFWHWFLLRVSKMILNDLNRSLEPFM